MQDQFKETPTDARPQEAEGIEGDPLHIPQQLQGRDPDTPVMMYCTGGIRCDIYSAYLRRKGFQNLYTLEGGVHNYFRQEGGLPQPSPCPPSTYNFCVRAFVHVRARCVCVGGGRGKGGFVCSVCGPGGGVERERGGWSTHFLGKLLQEATPSSWFAPFLSDHFLRFGLSGLSVTTGLPGIAVPAIVLIVAAADPLLSFPPFSLHDSGTDGTHSRAHLWGGSGCV